MQSSSAQDSSNNSQDFLPFPPPIIRLDHQGDNQQPHRPGAPLKITSSPQAPPQEDLCHAIDNSLVMPPPPPSRLSDKKLHLSPRNFWEN